LSDLSAVDLGDQTGKKKIRLIDRDELKPRSP